MKGTIIVLQPDGRRSEQVIDGPPTLDVLKAGLDGGYLEVIPGFTTVAHKGVVMHCVAMCDEDGKRKELPRNVYADIEWQSALQRMGPRFIHLKDYLVGPVIVVFGDKEWMEEL